MTVYLDAVGLIAPGMLGWAQGREILSGARAHAGAAMPAPRTNLLAANERRRTTAVIRLALQAAEDALSGTDIPAGQLCSVFASSSGDMEIVDKICAALATPERPVSPTQFHNSVHNAPAGYWSLGAATRMPSISIAAHERSFAAGLLEAWSMAEVEQAPVLLVVYDWPPPPTLHPHRPLGECFAVALVLTAHPGGRAAPRLTMELKAGTIDPMSDPSLEALRNANPAAHGLPMLASLARRMSATVCLPFTEHQVLAVQCQMA